MCSVQQVDINVCTADCSSVWMHKRKGMLWKLKWCMEWVMLPVSKQIGHTPLYPCSDCSTHCCQPGHS